MSIKRTKGWLADLFGHFVSGPTLLPGIMGETLPTHGEGVTKTGKVPGRKAARKRQRLARKVTERKGRAA